MSTATSLSFVNVHTVLVIDWGLISCSYISVDGGSQEDLVNVSKQNRQRAPPIRHRTEISDVHSGSEIDTEDELEMARKVIDDPLLSV